MRKRRRFQRPGAAEPKPVRRDSWRMQGSIILIASGASLAAGLATGAGALPALLFPKPSDRVEDLLLGFAAGVMLAASFFSLILPGLDAARAGSGSETVGTLIVIAAVLAGAACVALVNRYVPHEHFISGREGLSARRLRRIWLFVAAITLHNAPEGLAVGVGFGGGDIANGTSLALAIGLQNMPEGLAVATTLLSLGYSRGHAFLVALASGLVEPVGGFFGIAAVSLAAPVLPWALGFAAGAMIFVVSNEVIPETHRKGHETLATSGLMVGLAVMMFLDVALG